MPLIRRVPKRGFNNAEFKTKWAIANLEALNAFDTGATVDEAALLEAGVIRKPFDGLKILGSGQLTKKLAVVANHASASAKAAIEKAGGTLTIK